MSILTYQDGSVSIKNHQIIFTEGHHADSVNILLQGKVDFFLSPEEAVENGNEIDILKNSFKVFSMEKGSLIGIAGLFEFRKHLFSIRACEESSVYIFGTPDNEKLKSLLETNKDYGAFLMTSIASTVVQCEELVEKLENQLLELRTLTNNLLLYFWHINHMSNNSYTIENDIFLKSREKYVQLKDEKFQFPINFSEDFFSSDIIDNGNLYSYSPINEIEFFKHFLEMPIDLRKSFFGNDPIVTTFTSGLATISLKNSHTRLKLLFSEAQNLLGLLYSTNQDNNSNENILNEYVKCTCNNRFDTKVTQLLFSTLDFIVSKINFWSSLFEKDYQNNCNLDFIKAQQLISSVKLGEDPFSKSTDIPVTHTNVVSALPEELHDSAKKILEFAEFPSEKISLFLNCLENFRQLQDKFGLDDTTTKIRKTVSSMFFDLYEAVEKRVILERDTSRLYHMFLIFGYMDEKLLTDEQAISLYNAIDGYTYKEGSNIYTMKDWLKANYDIQKDPSINEFSMDYFDVFRDMKKRGEITDKEKQSYNLNKLGRLTFEVQNMFKSNHRLCYGQPMSYFPILHSDMIIRKIDKSLITREMVEESLKRILDLDFSAFHREVTYKSSVTTIEKELIMKRILPDIILIPTYGSRPIMWQEIAGKNRSTAGRFLIPIMSADNLDDMMVRLVGNFRWELCRTMMGVAWNDITQKSLTSEYTDYIQFYKKNKDLSEDAKEKIASQNSKYRSLMRDIFTSDYEQWFNYESKGVIRLNKVSRSALYKYCPFNKETREQLSKHPIFSEISVFFRNSRTKQIREIENRYNKYIRSGIELDIDLIDNLKFYKEN